MNKKINLLKQRYLEKKHPYWEQDLWIKKVNSIFTDIHYIPNVSLVEQYVLDSELCLIMPNYKQRNRERMDNVYKKKQLERIKLAKNKAKEVLEWFNNL